MVASTTPGWFRFALAWPLLGAMSSCHTQKPHPEILPQDAYVWQRSWTRSLREALSQSAPMVRAWRVLAAETEARDGFLITSADAQALAGVGRPVVAVMRINGSRLPADVPELSQRMSVLVSGWRTAGVQVAGIEIDYDCPSARLLQFGRFLKLFRAGAGGLPISVTAVPAWTASPDLSAVLAEVEETVLQVHSILGPEHGLFDPARARQWVEDWSLRTSTPFRVALPDYWSRVTWNRRGQVTAVESEISRYGPLDGGKELLVMPEDVGQFVRWVQGRGMARLRGLVWFRLPTAGDRRTWSTATWHAVMEGQQIEPAAPVAFLKTAPGGASDVYVGNRGEIDSRLPGLVEVVAQDRCAAADSLPPYSLEWHGSRLLFRLKDPQMLEGKREILIGWTRCASAQGAQVRERY